MASKKTVREEFIFKGSDEDFKRLMQGDEIYELFREMNKRTPPTTVTTNPFLPPDQRINVKYFSGGNYTIAYRAESDDSTRVIIERESEISWLEDWKSDLEKQGLIVEIPPEISVDEEILKRKFENLKPETQDEYRLKWEIMCEMDLEYQELALNQSINNPKPQMGDYRDRIIQILGPGIKGTSGKTLRNIRKFGKAGLLE